ncbi:MAG: folylpolyglutamate synthase/dihydrofolate synthase family protein [Nitrospirota bacterium]
MAFKETVQYLYGLQKFGTKLGLDNTRALLKLLDDPQDGIKFLHVTGTNGKGSVSALSAAALTAAGVRTGLYTSPHLVSFTERFRVGGREISEEDIVHLSGRLRALVEKVPDLKPTFFEFTTAMALEYFKNSGVEAAVLEVGMGGRLDSTNTVKPGCCVITNVELEHTEYLGDTIEAIAFEKAGIIKPGVPLVTSEKKPGIIEYLRGRCREADAPFYQFGTDYGYTARGRRWEQGRIVQEMDFWGPGDDIKRLEIPLIGAHQLENAATAACALRLFPAREGISERAIREGFKNVRWEGRLEIAGGSPLLVLDGAHNPASTRSVAKAVKEYFAGRYGRLILVIGVLKDKDFNLMLEILRPLSDAVVLTQADYERAVPAESLRDLLSGGPEVSVKESVAEAVAWALDEAAPEDMVLVTGSLYVIGEAKAWLEKKELFLKA